MTGLVIANQIPSNINTLERLHIWSAYGLAFVNPTLGVLESADRAEKVASAAIFQAADNTYRVLVRTVLPISPEFMTDRTIKIWMHTQEASNVALPAGFTTN